ncbi:MAG: NAD(P)/FAD-dependent oxidoreductase [Alphaproteobacteria bacterium]|nr:NAD(P)/FAD-dependent oxidoreductase [Alphaproteobacteria bacterium]
MPPLDVLIIGAGLSGVGAACQLTRELPHLRYALIEAREAIGGTWDLFRYPGVRSDTDMHSLGYGWRPWDQDRAIAPGARIRAYIQETAEEYGVVERVRFGRRVLGLSWDSEAALWTARIGPSAGGPEETLQARFVYSCTGYYRYDAGYTPDFEGMADFGGRVVHPQHWPEDLEVAGKRIIVIGSGATAVTLVPALAERGAQVTLLQRSPTYVIAMPSLDKLSVLLRRLLPAARAHALIKWKNTRSQAWMVRLARSRPALVRRVLLRRVARLLPEDVPLDPHFSPRYDPWDQRLCLVPDGDLFAALRSGRARVVTDTTERFEAEGVRVGSGDLLEADIVVTATGLRMELMGGIELRVDGERLALAERYTYKGMMFSGVPNHAFATGYTTAPWTLKVDLVTDYTCRLLAHMQAQGYRQVTPLPPGPEVADGGALVDLDSGYVHRAEGKLPRQGAAYPWRLHQSYAQDVEMFRHGTLEDEGVRFTRTPEEGRRAVREALATRAGGGSE